MIYEIKKWDRTNFGEISFENICRFYSENNSLTLAEKPPILRSFVVSSGAEEFIIRWNRYEENINSSGICKEATYFILTGNCELEIEKRTCKLKKDDYIYLQDCKYQTRATGNEPLEIVFAFKLSAETVNN